MTEKPTIVRSPLNTGKVVFMFITTHGLLGLKPRKSDGKTANQRIIRLDQRMIRWHKDPYAPNFLYTLQTLTFHTLMSV